MTDPLDLLLCPGCSTVVPLPREVSMITVRLGFATNSSSTHSIVILPHDAPGTDTDGQEFGWSFWTAGDEDIKRAWLGQIVRSRLHGLIGNEMATLVASSLVGAEVDAEGYVDHQSEPRLPLDRDGTVSTEFVRDFAAFLARPDVVILGGNDNTEETHPLASSGVEWSTGLPLDASDAIYCRKDKRDGYWSLFNVGNGTKVRMRFDAGGATVTRSEAPELVDVKITDYCPIGCAFCYQGSTTAGKHADAGWIQSLAYSLRSLGTFEVAIGGGEPTLHPDFVGVLRAFKSQQITPNFTTKRLDWLRDEAARTAILEQAGAFAYSATDAADVARFVEATEWMGWGRSHRANIQHVMGTLDKAGTLALVNAAKAAHLRVTLLGYKTVGRGSSVTPHDYSTWAPDIFATKARIGIDTALARTWERDLRTMGAWEGSYETKEGAFSCYVDAVAQTFARSSYEGPGVAIAERDKWGRVNDHPSASRIGVLFLAQQEQA